MGTIDPVDRIASMDLMLCGWRVRSTLPLPELSNWSGSVDAPTDIFITEGRVPERLDTATSIDRWLSVGSDGAVLMCVPDVLRFLVEGGRHITVQILGRRDAPDWRLFVLGSAIGYLCHQRGAFPLHAASVVIGDRTVALLGQTGAGKSTLALALVRRGHRLLSDDLTVVSRRDEQVCVLPAFPRLKLWRDTLEALGEDFRDLKRVREELEKFDLQPRDHFDPLPKHLDRIFVLDRANEPALVRLRAPAAMPVLGQHIARPKVARLLGRQSALFDEAVHIVHRVPVARLMRPLDFARLDETARLIEEAVLA